MIIETKPSRPDLNFGNVRLQNNRDAVTDLVFLEVKEPQVIHCVLLMDTWILNQGLLSTRPCIR